MERQKIKSKAVTIKFSPDFAQMLKEKAKAKSMSQSNYIEFLVRNDKK